MTNVFQFNKSQGFTRMDNSLMEAMAAVDLPARELRILMAIARQTIGFHTETKRLTADEIGKFTNMRRDVVSKSVSHLLARRIIFRVGGSRGEIGISPVNEWSFYEENESRLTETKSSHSDNVVSLPNDSSETKTATSLLYIKKLPLVTVPTEQITAPQGAAQADQSEQGEEPVEQGEPEVTAKPVLVTFDGEDFTVDPSLITKWTKAYAPIDVESEIVRAAAWASGAKRKKNYRRFLVNWLSKAFKENPNGADESNIPVDKIIALYHKVCPNLPKVAVETDRKLRSMIVERWNESEGHQNSPFWRTQFERANLLNDVYYCGERVKPRLEVICSRAVFRRLEEQA